MAIVIIVSRPDQPELHQEIPLTRKVILGQSGYCDVKLDDRLVSGMQCQIQPTKSGHVIVTNLDQKREVYINQNRLKRANLKVDDVLKIGPFVLQLDPKKLTDDEIKIINTEYEEYVS